MAYPKAVEEAADKIPAGIPAEEIARREDCRPMPTFTIDPRDAKDFDDALSIRPAGDGLWEVGVHIADVSYYVHEGSIIDKEAEKRATSVYLVDRTIPMLPERLCNDLCSLRPERRAAGLLRHLPHGQRCPRARLAYCPHRHQERPPFHLRGGAADTGGGAKATSSPELTAARPPWPSSCGSGVSRRVPSTSTATR